MSYLPGDAYYRQFTTTNPFSGAATDASPLPVAVATRNGADDPTFVLAVAHLAFGRYVVAGTIPATYHAGDDVEISVTATVAGITGSEVIDSFRVDTPAVSSAATAYAPPTQTYCTDEDIALRALGDYVNVCPASQVLAHGTDGVIAPADRWTLSSAAADLLGNGLSPGHVVWLTRPASAFGPQGQLLAVDAVSAAGATLRRLGQRARVGQPPAPATGLAGVEFLVLTFDPQINQATFEINQIYNIDPNLPTGVDRALYQVRQLQQLCVLWVLERAYAAQGKRKDEDFALKRAQYEAELADLRTRVVVQRGPYGEGAAASGPLDTRIVRG